jgi:hypothetical protein
MRRTALISSLAALAVPALVALGAGPALASGTAPAPDCESFSSIFFCDASSPVTPITWTETIRIDGITSMSTFSGPAFLRSGCELKANYTFSFSYVSGGVTFVSGSSRFLCTSNAPE